MNTAWDLEEWALRLVNDVDLCFSPMAKTYIAF